MIRKLNTLKTLIKAFVSGLSRCPTLLQVRRSLRALVCSRALDCLKALVLRRMGLD